MYKYRYFDTGIKQFPEPTEENHEHLSQDVRSLGLPNMKQDYDVRLFRFIKVLLQSKHCLDSDPNDLNHKSEFVLPLCTEHDKFSLVSICFTFRFLLTLSSSQLKSFTTFC